MERVLITGVAGFIGSHLAEYLLNKKIEVIGIDNFDSLYPRQYKEQNLKEIRDNNLFHFIEGDILDGGMWDSITEKVDAVVHLAAKAGVLNSIKEPEAYIKCNILGTQKVLEFMRKSDIKKFIFASSSSVYGNNEKIPFAEEHNVSNTISPYAFTKKACEVLTHTYHHLYNIDTVCLRFFTVIGPRQRPDLAIRKFIDLIIKDKPIEMYGDGTSARDYTYIEDIIEGIANSLNFVTNNEKVHEIFNLGNNKPVQLSEMIHTIYKILGKEPNVIQKEMQPGDVNLTFADISKASRILQYKPNTPFAQGVENFIQWYIKNKN